MKFLRIWFLGLIKPSEMFDEIKNKPAPFWGMWAVLIRFVVTSLTSILSLYLLHRLPFAPSNLAVLSIENYYKAEIFFLPVWGLGIWILMGGITHIAIRISGRKSSYDLILNVIGFGMLIPMPVLWLFDWATIALGWYGLLVQAISHSLVQIWEAGIEAFGLRRIFGLKVYAAIAIAIVINAIYVLLAMLFIR